MPDQDRITSRDITIVRGALRELGERIRGRQALAQGIEDDALALACGPHGVRVTAVMPGVIETDDRHVVGYREKPTLNYDVSMGIYVYEPRALEYLPANGPCQFPDLVLRLLEAGEKVAAYKSEADWYDIGTIAEYERAVADTKLFAHDASPRRVNNRHRA